MSSRAVRKVLKRLEEQKQQKTQAPLDYEQQIQEDSEDDTVVPANPFALLNETQDLDENAETITKEESESQEEVKENTKAKFTPTPSKKSKAKRKKRRGPKDDTPGSQTTAEIPSTPTALDLDEVDRAIQEISQRYSDIPSPSPSPNPAATTRKYSLLSIQPNLLDADVELRKLFGKVVDVEAKESRRPFRGIPPRVINRIKHSHAQRRHTLMKPTDEWQLFAAYNKSMLSMDIVERDGSVTKFKFVHSKRYQEIQMEFFVTALGGDGNILMELLQQNPFHVDTCIQVSEILKHQGSLSEAADLMERAIFSLDCGLHSLFNLTLGTTRLPFKYYENRALYLAIWHHMESLGRRGCWRTCLEFNKLLFALEPEGNPYAALLAIDYPAIKAREYNFLIDLRDSHEWIDETAYLLNIHFSASIAEYMREKEQKLDHTKSSEALSQAIQKFPWVIAQLFYALKLPFPSEFPTTVPPSPLQALYTDLYIHRSKELWTISELSTWLAKVSTGVATEVSSPSPSQTLESVPMNVARHIFVLNVPALLTHVPREYTARTQLATDPLPPVDSVSPYEASLRSLPGDEAALQRWIAGFIRGERNEDQDGEAEDAFEEDQGDEGEEQDDGSFVAQLTNTFRYVFGWSNSRGDSAGEGQDEPQGDTHGLN